MTESRDIQITNLSDDELEQVAGGATDAEVASASMEYDAAQQQANADRGAVDKGI